jgi:hypothetical protein
VSWSLIDFERIDQLPEPGHDATLGGLTLPTAKAESIGDRRLETYPDLSYPPSKATGAWKSTQN